jgi:hypothetical protein
MFMPVWDSSHIFSNSLFSPSFTPLLVVWFGKRPSDHVVFISCSSAQDLHLDLDSRPRLRGQPEDKLEGSGSSLAKAGGEARGGRTRDWAEEMQIVREAIASLRSMFR